MVHVLKKSFFVSILFSSLFIHFLLGVPTVSAQYTSDGQVFPLAGPINIISPTNLTYDSNNLTLNVTSIFLLGPKYATFSYSLDGASNITIPLTGTQEPREATRTYENGTIVTVNSTLMVPFTLNGITSLLGLSEGPHQIVVYARYTANNVIGYDESTVNFTIGSSSESTHIPEFPSWTILPLFLIASIIVIVCKKKLTKT